jgi:hypothetical protein
MFKLLTAVLFLTTLLSTPYVHANGELQLPGQLSTKGLVRMSLWYEGLQGSDPQENQSVKGIKISEELERALLDD